MHLNVCPLCELDNEATAQSCAGCGVGMVAVCGQCESVNATSCHHCLSCGALLPAGELAQGTAGSSSVAMAAAPAALEAMSEVRLRFNVDGSVCVAIPDGQGGSKMYTVNAPPQPMPSGAEWLPLVSHPSPTILPPEQPEPPEQPGRPQQPEPPEPLEPLEPLEPPAAPSSALVPMPAAQSPARATMPASWPPRNTGGSLAKATVVVLAVVGASLYLASPNGLSWLGRTPPPAADSVPAVVAGATTTVPAPSVAPATGTAPAQTAVTDLVLPPPPGAEAASPVLTTATGSEAEVASAPAAIAPVASVPRRTLAIAVDGAGAAGAAPSPIARPRASPDGATPAAGDRDAGSTATEDPPSAGVRRARTAPGAADPTSPAALAAALGTAPVKPPPRSAGDAGRACSSKIAALGLC